MLKFSSRHREQHANLSGMSLLVCLLLLALLISMMDVLKENQECELMITLKSEGTLLQMANTMFEKENDSGLTHGLLVMTRMINGIIEHRQMSGVSITSTPSLIWPLAKILEQNGKHKRAAADSTGAASASTHSLFTFGGQVQI